MKFENINSVEQGILNTVFEKYPLMDMNISKVIESFIYKKITTYYPNGCVMEEYTKRYENCIGEYIIWFDEKDPKNSKSRIFRKSNYNNNGKKDYHVKYYLNGQKQTEMFLNDGFVERCYNWYENGKKESIEITYKETINIQTESDTHVTPSDEVASIFRNGTSFYNNDTNSIKEIYTYKNYKLEGLYQEYFENGNIRLEIEYKDGIKNGFWKKYFRQGGLMYEINYIDDKYDGEWREYWFPNVLREYSTYKNGKKIGESFSFFVCPNFSNQRNTNRENPIYMHKNCNCKNRGLSQINIKYDYSKILREGDIIQALHIYSYKNEEVKIIEEWWSCNQIFNIEIETTVTDEHSVNIYRSYKQWDEKGLMEIEYEKKNGLLHGKTIRYKHGKKIEELMYKDNKLEKY